MLGIIHPLRKEFNWMPRPIRRLLFNYSTNTRSTSITTNTCGQCSIKNLQHRNRTKALLNLLKGLLLTSTPNKLNIFPSKHGKGRCNGSKTTYKSSIVVSKPQKLLYFIYSSGNRPLFHSINLPLFNHDTTGGHPVT